MIWNAYKKDSRRLDTKAEPDAVRANAIFWQFN